MYGKAKPIRGKLIISEVDSTGRYRVYFIPDQRTGKAILVGTVTRATAESILKAVSE